MESLVAAFQGPYAYLVIFQVLVVAMLLVALLWLVMRRALEGDAQRKQFATAGTPPPSPLDAVAAPEAVAPVEAAPPPPPPPEAVVPAPEPPAPPPAPVASPIVPADGDEDPNKASTRSLKDKIKYLESKLLEYEILQEEIGTLTGLKMENEHLKAKVAKLEKKLADYLKEEPGKEPGQGEDHSLAGSGQEPTFEGLKSEGAAPEPVADAAAEGGPLLEGILRQIDGLSEKDEPAFVQDGDEVKKAS